MPRVPQSFEEHAMQVVRSLVEYGRYGEDERKAASALARRSGRPRSACLEILPPSIRAYEAGIEFVAAHKDAYDRRRAELAEEPGAEFDALEAGFLDTHPEVPRDLLANVLFFIHDWHHLR